MPTRQHSVSLVAAATAIAGFLAYLTLLPLSSWSGTSTDQLNSVTGSDTNSHRQGRLWYREAVIFSVPTASAAGEKGQALFDQKCKGCHTIGGGKTVGPDLKGITARRDQDWLVKFTAAPDRLIAQGDPIATQLVKEYGLPMPNPGVSEDQARDILAYIESRSGDVSLAGTPASPAVLSGMPAQTAVQAKLAGNPESGRNIFAGAMPLKNGGASCLSCHSVAGFSGLGGGTLAVDLTRVYPKMGEQALTASLKTTPFSIMKDVYAGRSLTEDEIADLVAFLAVSGEPAQNAHSAPFPIFIVGAIGAVAFLAVIQFLWRGRLSGVRGPLVNGGGR